MNEAEWQTSKTRIDTRLRSLCPQWKIVRYRDGLGGSSLHCAAVGDDSVKKITGNANVDRPLQRIREFRNTVEVPSPAGAGEGGRRPGEGSGSNAIPALEFVVFLRPVKSLKPGGRAAMVLPDNCLFEGKAGEVFELLMQDCALHTVLRLPRGTFTPYSQGVKANVIFFQKGRPTDEVWIFDARSNVPGITKKDRPLTAQHFAEFEKAYGKDPNGLSRRTESERFRRIPQSEIRDRQFKLDVTWLKDDSLEDTDELPEPQDLATEAVTELEAVINDLKEIIELVEKEEGVEK